MDSADVLESRDWGVSVYGLRRTFEPEVRVGETSSIQVPVVGGVSSLFNRTDASIEMEQNNQAVVGSLRFRPGNGLQYELRVGQVQDFLLEYSSGSLTNSLESLGSGFLWGVGGRWNIRPGTIVSTAFSLEVRYTQLRSTLDRFSSAGNLTPVQFRLEQDELQSSVNISYRWKRLEPYGGLKVLQTTTRLKDKTNKGKVRGVSTGMSPFVGFRWEFFNQESFVIEASFVEEEMIAAGLNLKL